MSEDRTEQVRLYLPDVIADYPCRTYQEHIFDGSTATMELWPKDRVEKLVEELSKLDYRDKEVVYDKLPPCWVIAIADHVLSPRKSYHWTKYLDGKDMEIISFKTGEHLNPSDSGIDFEVFGLGDDIFIHVIADDPDIPGHNYDPEGYFETIAPIIPPNHNVYIHASAATFIILAAEKTYAPISKSVSISFMHDLNKQGQRLYTCCYTTTPEIELGDTRPLIDPWDVWPFFLDREKMMKELQEI